MGQSIRISEKDKSQLLCSLESITIMAFVESAVRFAFVIAFIGMMSAAMITPWFAWPALVFSPLIIIATLIIARIRLKNRVAALAKMGGICTVEVDDNGVTEVQLDDSGNRIAELSLSWKGIKSVYSCTHGYILTDESNRGKILIPDSMLDLGAGSGLSRIINAKDRAIVDLDQYALFIKQKRRKAMRLGFMMLAFAILMEYARYIPKPH